VREREENENETNKQERRSSYLIEIIFPQVPNDERHNMSLQRTLLLLLFPASSYHSHRPPPPTVPWSLVLFSSLLLVPCNQIEGTKRRRRNEEEELGLGFVRLKKESKKKN
jgi:hypothetical protein